MYLTLILFAAAGAVGMYLLTTRCLRVSTEAALLAGGLFLFNGFLFHRMVIGHLTYHVFGLLPLLAWVVLRTRLGTVSRGGVLGRVMRPSVPAGLVLAYVTYAGALNFQIPFVLSVCALVLIVQLRDGADLRPWLVLVAGGVFGVALSLVKLAPAFVMTAQFPRAYIPQFLFESPTHLLGVLSAGLFVPAALPAEVRLPHGGLLGRHELEFGVSVVPPLLVALAIARLWREGELGPLLRRRRITLGLLGTLMAVPLLLTFGPPWWGEFLLRVPVINNNTTFVRWWAIYLLPLMACAALAVDALARAPRARVWIVAGGLLCVMAQHSLTDAPYYRDGRNLYDPALVSGAFGQSRAGAEVPPITSIGPGSPQDERGLNWYAGQNDALVSGRSAWPCYDPLFGTGWR